MWSHLSLVALGSELQRVPSSSKLAQWLYSVHVLVRLVTRVLSAPADDCLGMFQEEVVFLLLLFQIGSPVAQAGLEVPITLFMFTPPNARIIGVHRHSCLDAMFLINLCRKP